MSDTRDVPRVEDVDISRSNPALHLCFGSSISPPIQEHFAQVVCIGHPSILAPFGHITPRNMMFCTDIEPGNGQGGAQQGSPYFAYNQGPVLPHAVVSDRRATLLSIRRERSPQHFAASSSYRTAKSGHWSMMPPKRTASGSPSGTPGKVKTEQKPEDFSNSVKKRLQSSTRTGQACDRCKVWLHSRLKTHRLTRT
jgi:hypothetical protein